MQKKTLISCFIISLIFLTNAYAISDIRPSILAGTWYPAEKKELLNMIHEFLSNAKIPSINGNIKAIIVPHAGYIYSGAVAAHAFKALKDKKITRVIMIGPSHRALFKGVSVNLQKGYNTPLGIVPVDQEFAKRLIKEIWIIHYVPMAHAFEHCLKIELPLLQTVLGKFKIVPMLLGQQDMDTCKELARCILKLLSDSEDTLILASSDLSHYHSYNEAVDMDHTLIKHIKDMDPYGLNKDLSEGKCEACGKGAIITTLFIAKKLGANRAIILKYANSGDVTGDHSRVVGYVAAILIKAYNKDRHQ